MARSQGQSETPNLTLRQIEVIRAIMVTGTIAGAAKYLGVSAPGVSRLMKYTEDCLGLRLFDRQNNRFVPSAQAEIVFDLLDGVYQKVGNLGSALAALRKGDGQNVSFASVPSIGQVMMPRAVKRLRAEFPDLELELDILKIEDAVDYLLLGRGEVVALSSRFDHPVVRCEPLAEGRLVCIVAENSPLAALDSITPSEIARHPLIGIDPGDPYGRIMSDVVKGRGLSYHTSIRARFGTTVCRLVAEGLGIAIIDVFTVAHGTIPGLRQIEIDAPTSFQTYVAFRSDRPLSIFADRIVQHLRLEMAAYAPGQVAGRPIRQTALT